MKKCVTIDSRKLRKKSGVALVITLGFLAILTIIAVAFAMQMRLERLAGRGVLATAQTRHLLDTALSRAMADINFKMGSNMYPPPNMASVQSLAGRNVRTYTHQDGVKLSDTMDLTVIPRNDPGDASAEYLGFSDTEFIPTGWPDTQFSETYEDFRDAFDDAEWQDVLDADDKIVGRVGYFIVNMSGLLDANFVGGHTNTGSNAGFTPRENGRTPAEIQLSRYLLNEFSQAADGTFPGLNASGAGYIVGDALKATPTDLSAGLAMVYNRTNAWRRFETVRDFYRLNQLGHYGVPNADGGRDPVQSKILRNRPKNFSTFSYSPPDDRLYMGRTEAEVIANEKVIEAALPATVDPEFVMNQLRDYLDLDYEPEDAAGDYTDFSVEPVPLINEIAVESNFKVTMKIESGAPVFTLVGHHELTVEAWYPFAVVSNDNEYSVSFNGDTTFPSGTEDLFGSFSPSGGLTLEDKDGDGVWEQGDFGIVTEQWTSDEVKYDSVGELLAGFEALNGGVIKIDEITISSASGTVDRVEDVEIDIGEGIDTFDPDPNDLSDGGVASNNFEVGLAVVDPRLNWDGSDASQWISVGDDAPIAPGASAPIALSLGKRNVDVSNSIGDTPDHKDVLYVRNDDRIDSPYEFTYFLYDKTKPWQTFQFFKDNDEPDGTRFIVDYLHTYPNGPPRQGRVNPNSENLNVLGSVFYRVPIDPFAQDFDNYIPSNRLDSATALLIGQFLNEKKRMYEKKSDLGNMDYERVRSFIPGASDDPWKVESVLRNSAELFEPRNNTFAVFLVAQQVIDADEDGTITEEEVQLTQRAIAYVWREPGLNPQLGSSCVFYVRSESLGVFGTGESKALVLDAFRPLE